MGIVGNEKTIVCWIRRGWLSGRVGGRRWNVTMEALYDFVQDSRYCHVWTEVRIVDPALRAYAREVRPSERFLTVGQVAAQCFVSTNTVAQWIRKGWLRAVRNGNWLVPALALLDFEMPRVGGYRRRGGQAVLADDGSASA